MDDNAPSENTHTLRCLEVWGGSDSADHAASVPGLDISVRSRPLGGDAGGDLYLISSCSSGLITRMLLADVSGHGEQVAEFSRQLRTAMHKSINTIDQSKLARALNEAFEQIGGGEKFATALLMTYYAPLEHLIIVNAGHPPPLLSRAGSGSWEPIDLKHADVIRSEDNDLRVGFKNLPLGIVGSTNYEQFAIRVHPGDRVVAYTDAFSEARDPASGEILGIAGLAALLDGVERPEDGHLAGAILDAIDQSRYELGDDDRTLLTLSLSGGGLPKLGLGTIKRFVAQGFGLGHKDTVPTSTEP